MSKQHKNIIIGVTGSVATIKLKELVRQLQEKLTKVNICIIPTKNALHFCPDLNEMFNKHLPALKDRLEYLKIGNSSDDNVVFAFTDDDEWSSWSKRADPVLHIELRKWADVCLLAPLDANTLAKISSGMCDNLLTSVLRAWDVSSIRTQPVIMCPAMNTLMYRHPLTKKQLDLLVNEFGFTLVDSVVKKLICGDVGLGAMALVEDIVDKVVSVLNDSNQ